MKIRLEVEGKVFEYEKQPMEKTRFRALCRLAHTAILGALFLDALKIVGFPALAISAILVFFYGVYRAIESA